MRDTDATFGLRRIAAPAVFLAAALAVTGCGKGFQPVKGKLVWKDGTPAKELKGSQVVFESAELKFSGRGTVDDQGEFTITSIDPDDGVPVGTYKVGIIEDRKAFPDGSLGPGLMDDRQQSPEQSGLTATVGTGTNEVTLTVERARKRK